MLSSWIVFDLQKKIARIVKYSQKIELLKNYSLQTYMNIIPELVFFLFSIAISIVN